MTPVVVTAGGGADVNEGDENDIDNEDMLGDELGEGEGNVLRDGGGGGGGR